MASQQWTVIIRDTKNEILVIKRVDETGADISGDPQIQIDLQALRTVAAAAGMTNVVIKPILDIYKDASSCANYQRIILGTDSVAL